MRKWFGSSPDDGSVHCLGNGRLLAYEQGPDIIQVFGPPYSSPSFTKLLLQGADLECVSLREKGTAVWNHRVSGNGGPVGEMTDFVDWKLPCTSRRLTLTQPLELSLVFDESVQVIDNASRFTGLGPVSSVLAIAEAGTFIYGRYPSPRKLYLQVLVTGNAKILAEDSGHRFRILCEEGQSNIYFVGGSSYPECMRDSEAAVETGVDAMLERTRNGWSGFSKRRLSFEDLLPENLPKREALLDAIDEISVLIKAQQASEGTVLAGHNYHLGYIRDQYGVARCLLKLGYLEEAKAVMNFYWEIWKKYGRLHNAQAAGVDGIFHVHENDEVEITGYLIIQAFDYLKVSGEEAYLRTILPMLEWAWEVSKRHLADGMLPFNGDETYVAGGVLPRHTLNDGSAEATLLFITAGERLLSWLEHHKAWDSRKLLDNRKALDSVKDRYRANFWDGRRILTNNPERAAKVDLPRFRHGVCEACFAFGWTEKSSEDRYLCPQCLSSRMLERVPGIHYEVKSVSLIPLYIEASMFTREEIAGLVEEIARQYNKTGKLPSRPDGGVTVGYDYGLLLYNLKALGHPLAGELYDKTLEILDPTGAWVEYYQDGKPMGTRCRPWESGINLEALIDYAMSLQ